MLSNLVISFLLDNKLSNTLLVLLFFLLVTIIPEYSKASFIKGIINQVVLHNFS